MRRIRRYAEPHTLLEERHCTIALRHDNHSWDDDRERASFWCTGEEAGQFLWLRTITTRQWPGVPEYWTWGDGIAWFSDRMDALDFAAIEAARWNRRMRVRRGPRRDPAAALWVVLPCQREGLDQPTGRHPVSWDFEGYSR